MLQEVGQGVEGAGQEHGPQVGADAAGLGSPQQGAQAALATAGGPSPDPCTPGRGGTRLCNDPC